MIPPAFRILAMLACALCGLAGAASAADVPAAGPSATDPALVDRGRVLYGTLCVMCHGESGAGNGPVAAALDPRPRDLAAPGSRETLTEERIARAVREGGAAVGISAAMPAFGTQVGDDDLRALVAWVRDLGKTAPPASAPAQATGTAVAAPPATSPLTPAPAPVAAGAGSPFSRTRFHLSGFATARLDVTADGGPNFGTVILAPVMLWRLHPKVLVEAEFEFSYANGTFEVGLEYAQIDMLPTAYTTVTAGMFLVPLGIYGERLHPGWINRMVDAPYPYQGGHHSGFMPMSGIGIQLRGAVPLGPVAAFNYTAFAINGPGEADGELSIAGSVPDNNWNKLVGGRVGVLPVRQLEVGVSGATGLWDDDETARYTALVADLTAAHKGLNLQGEAIFTWVDGSDGERDLRRLWWGQVAYRFVGQRGVLGMLELVARYGGAMLPEDEVAHDHSDLMAIRLPTPLSAGHDDTTGTADTGGVGAGPGAGNSHQVGGGVNLYPIPSLAVRVGGHYTLGPNIGYVGAAVAVGM